MLGVLRDHIGREGSIPFSKFMELALYHQRFGYYNTVAPIGGASGDFITAPEISQLFGETLSIWVATAWEQLGKPKKFLLVDLGPGRGTMISDIMRCLAKLKDLFSALDRVCMVEISSLLRGVQQQQLTNYSNIYWYSDLSEIPEGLPALFIGNEFLDALPIDQYVCDGSGWSERRVSMDENRLAFCCQKSELEHPLIDQGQMIEISRLAKRLVDAIKLRMKKFGGKAVFLDYGYLNPPYVSTVQSVSGHQYNSDLLSNPGFADITAYVDFKALGLWPITSQREFLLELGFLELANRLMHRANRKQQFDIITAVDRLTSINKMGGLFKVAQL